MSPKRAIEESPEAFYQRFQAHALEVYLFPEPWGSPLVEVLCGEQVVYAFDRGAPPAPTGRVKALLHGWCGRPSPWKGRPS